MIEFPAHPFWDFALQVYRCPGVSDACLQVQEGNHVDVNLLLFVSWLGASGRGRLSSDDVRRCMDTVGAWHESVVKPLRGVRRILKVDLGARRPDLTQALRREIQAREIDAEHIEQLLLVDALPRAPQAGVSPAAAMTDAACNALLYVTCLGYPVAAPTKASLTTIVGAACPELPLSQVRAAVEAA